MKRIVTIAALLLAPACESEVATEKKAEPEAKADEEKAEAKSDEKAADEKK